jgi:YggT family protein
VLAQLLDVIIWLVIVDAVLSWFMAPDSFPKSLTTAMLEPIYRPIRNLVSFGGGIDFSPIIVIVALNVVQAFVR